MSLLLFHEIFELILLEFREAALNAGYDNAKQWEEEETQILQQQQQSSNTSVGSSLRYQITPTLTGTRLNDFIPEKQRKYFP